MAEDVLQLTSGGLVSQLLRGGNITAGGLLLANPLARRRRVILGALFTSPADALHELLDLAIVSSAVTGIGVDRA